jgi:hypothetical protein
MKAGLIVRLYRSLRLDLLAMIFGPRCESCNKLEAYIQVCDFCLKNNVTKIRNRYRHYSSSSGKKMCRICGDIVGQDAHSFCYRCVPQHPDDTHMNDSAVPASDPGNGWWSKAIRAGGWNTEKGKANTMDCPDCGGLLVMEIDNEKPKYISSDHIEYVTRFRYYKKGNKKPTREPFYCENTQGSLQKIDIETLQATCEHDYITVLEPIKKTYQEYMSDTRNNDTIMEYLSLIGVSVEEYVLSLANTKSTIKWCWICGQKTTFEEIKEDGSGT